MKIYTRSGDDGTTGLYGGPRARKSDARFECCGTIDELNANLGLAAVLAPTEILQRIHKVQADLFVLGSHLATPPQSALASSLPPLDESLVTQLEQQIDEAEQVLPPMRQFILPGGSELAARLHQARTVCRRAERIVVRFAEDHPLPTLIVVYLNRLSDWLFVQARLANHLAGTSDIPWNPRA
jgi:cob(I)alamin adenosyltransferase